MLKLLETVLKKAPLKQDGGLLQSVIPIYEELVGNKVLLRLMTTYNHLSIYSFHLYTVPQIFHNKTINNLFTGTL